MSFTLIDCLLSAYHKMPYRCIWILIIALFLFAVQIVLAIMLDAPASRRK
ncbi:hypothetical protein ACUY4R_002237 [Kosakonia sp. BK9b]